MESFNNSNNFNIELAQQKKHQQFQKIKKILKSALKKFSSTKKIVEEVNHCEEENNFNEMLKRRMEAQQNLINEQIVGEQEKKTIGYCFVENEHGKFYWSADINRFVAVDRDLIASQFCTTSHQQAQVQCY